MRTLLSLACVLSACTADYQDFRVIGGTASSGGEGAVGAGPGAGATGAGTGAAGNGAGGMGGTGGQGAATGGGGCGGASPAVVGCSDGTRELFEDIAAAPSIAGCSGTWQLGGTQTTESQAPQCGRGAGNPGCVPDGSGCSVADLCAEGWHVCTSSVEVAAKSASGCAAVPNQGTGHWLTRQMVDGSEACTTQGNAHFVGCGNAGEQLSMYGSTCEPLNDVIGGVHGCPPPWYCGPTSQEEPFTVHKTGPELGGALCCID